MKAKIGRKSKYYTHVQPKLDLIQGWRQKGDSEEAIAKKLGIAYSTLSEYKLKFSEFVEALSISKEKLVNNLKKSLYKEALGYSYEEVKTLIEESYLGNKKKIEKTKKIARSQANLLIFALCNLCPEEFQRVDKEAIKELKDEIHKKVNIENNKLDKIMEVLYGPAIKEKEKNSKNSKKE
jgi:transcriptional regulator with XRE-family HTH domain